MALTVYIETSQTSQEDMHALLHLVVMHNCTCTGGMGYCQKSSGDDALLGFQLPLP